MAENDNNVCEPERGAVASLFLYGGLVVTGLLLSQFAFSRKVRNQILERDGGRCVVCGSTDHLEAAHINHDRDNKNYDNVNNGRTLCSGCHYNDHILRHGHNGLNKRQNEWAINKISERLDY